MQSSLACSRYRTSKVAMLRRIALTVGALLLVLASACTRTTEEKAATEPGRTEGVVKVYNGRHYGIEPVFDEFTRQTGIKVEFTTGGDSELRERIQAEGPNTSADVYMAADAANLYLAAQAGLLRGVESEILSRTIPSNYRDPEGRWFGLSKRVRAIAYSADRVSASDLSTYEALGEPRWRGRLCLRPATNAYTKSLVAGLIATRGREQAEAIVRSWVANDPVYIDSDVDIVKTIAAGRCDVAIINHYYLARLLDQDPTLPVKIFWPDQAGRGAHVNVSGAGVTSWAKNPEAAQRLIEWLATSGQQSFAAANFEFPIVPSAKPHPLLDSWGPFREDSTWVGEYGRLQAEAVTLMDQVGYK